MSAEISVISCGVKEMDIEPLIQLDDVTLKIQWKPLISKFVKMVLVTSFTVFGLGLSMFVQSEWTQSQLQRKYFTNESVQNNFSACADTNVSDPDYIRYKSVQQDSAKWVTYFTIAQHVPMFLVNTLLNGYTDTYGRKFLFVLITFGQCVKYTLMTLVIHYNGSFYYVAALSVLDGLMGSIYGLLAVSFAYIADITHKENHRVLGIVLVEATLAFSLLTSSLLSGYFIQTLGLGYFYTSMISAVTCFLALMVAVVLLPESLSDNKRRPRASVLGTLKSMVQFYISKTYKGKRLKYILLVIIFSLAAFCGTNRNSLEILYFLGQPFCWGPSKIGVFSSVKGAALGAVGLSLMSLLQKCMSNEAIGIAGIVSNISSFIIEAVAQSNVMIYMVPVTGILSFLVIPMTRGLLSNMTDPDKQGALFSGVAVLEILVSLTASFSQNEIYAATYSFMNGFVFLVIAGFAFINLGFMTAFYIMNKKNPKISYKHLPSLSHQEDSY